MRVLMTVSHPRDATLGSPKCILRMGAALSERGHEVDFLFLDALPRAIRDRPRLHPIAYPVAVARAARQRRYDVAHVSSGDGWILARMKRPGMTLINQVLGSEHLLWSDMQLSDRLGETRLSRAHRIWFGGIRLRQVAATYAGSDAVVCLAETDRRYVVRRGWVPDGRAFTVAPGVDPIYLDAGTSPLDGNGLIFLASWTDRKGRRELMEAWPRIRSKHQDATLTIAGAHVAAERVLSDFAPSAGVTVLPVIPEPADALVSAMKASSVGVFPTRYEGFGIAFLEMMAVGLPVIGTRTGGMLDVIEHGVDGLLISRRDAQGLFEAADLLLGDEELRARLGRAASQKARGFTWQRTGSELERVYESVAA